MADVIENHVINGRTFRLQIHGVQEDADHERWVGWITVDGKEREAHAQGTIGPCLSEGHVGNSAERRPFQGWAEWYLRVRPQ